MNEQLEQGLQVGTKIKIGKKYSEEHGFEPNQIIELVEGVFDEDNGLYTTTSTAPSVWNETLDEFDSIYHMFGNNLEDFMDCEIVEQATNNEAK